MAATLEGYDNWMRSSLGKAFSKVLGTYQSFTNLTNLGVSFSFPDALYILLTLRYPLRTWRNEDSLSTKHLPPPAIWKTSGARAQRKARLWRSYSVWLLGKGQGELGSPGKKQDDRKPKEERRLPVGHLWKWQYFSPWLSVVHVWS